MTRVVATSLCVLSLLGIGLGYVLLHPELIISCPGGPYANCISQSWDLGVGKPLFVGIRLLPFLFLALVFVRSEVFKTWVKVFIPLATIAFIGILASPPIGNPLHYEIDRTRFTELSVQFLVVISALTIAWKYWRLKRNKSAP